MSFFTERSGIPPKQWNALMRKLPQEGFSLKGEYILNPDGFAVARYLSRGYPEVDSYSLSFCEDPPEGCREDVERLRALASHSTSC